ncbi:hypothetical protein SAMN05445060_0131 [Williamsia sterculiae]|uniref:Uncharacterized protein n=1 Tax=Williamsia sterculiae TaxID=1344003 RepID=A0A1N7CH44_9NOCA|nr:hypothetical protein SAMN05445060_0131 [Williamsia sterculiae]
MVGALVRDHHVDRLRRDHSCGPDSLDLHATCDRQGFVITFPSAQGIKTHLLAAIAHSTSGLCLSALAYGICSLKRGFSNGCWFAPTAGRDAAPGCVRVRPRTDQPLNLRIPFRRAARSPPDRLITQTTVAGSLDSALSEQHFDYYLDDVTFRLDSRNANHRGLRFYRLIEQAVSTGPQPPRYRRNVLSYSVVSLSTSAQSTGRRRHCDRSVDPGLCEEPDFSGNCAGHGARIAEPYPSVRQPG